MNQKADFWVDKLLPDKCSNWTTNVEKGRVRFMSDFPFFTTFI